MTISTIEPTALAPAPGSSGANLIREAAAVMVDAHALASAVCNTQMIPKHFQGKPDECAAAMLYGASLGLDPMQSVRQIYVIHGQAALYARAMSALTLGAGHEVWTISSADNAVTVGGKRRGSDHAEEITWTIDRANKAGYTNNAKYKTDPQAMLYAKALSEICRKIAPDVLSGVYSVEELQMERWEQQPAAAPVASNADRMRAAIGAAPPDEPEPAPDVEPERLDPRSALAKRMFATIHDAGISEDKRLAFVSEVVGRQVGSSKELTEDEARQVIDACSSQQLPMGGEPA